MKTAKLSILFVLVLLSCEKEDVGSLVIPIQIRILNQTPYDLENITVDTSGGVNSYDDVKSLTYSSYKTFDFAYAYPFIAADINGKRFVFQPIDFVGETKYVAGKYTYVLHIADFERGILSVNWIRD